MRTVVFFAAMGLCLALIPRQIQAKEQHGAHVHGEAKLNLVISGKTAVAEFEAPAMSIYGFEHEPKTTAQTKARDSAIEHFKKDGAKMLQFAEKLSCQLELKNVDPLAKDKHHDEVAEGIKKTEAKVTKVPGRKAKEKHGEVHAVYSVTCLSDLSGSTLKFGFWNVFPELVEVHVQVLGEKAQTGGEFSKKNNSLKL